VRQLERNIGKVVRKLAVKVAGGESEPFTVTAVDLTHLGPEMFPMAWPKRKMKWAW
jgi:ATP-dependent Lon protease